MGLFYPFAEPFIMKSSGDVCPCDSMHIQVVLFFLKFFTDSLVGTLQRRDSILCAKLERAVKYIVCLNE